MKEVILIDMDKAQPFFQGSIDSPGLKQALSPYLCECQWEESELTHEMEVCHKCHSTGWKKDFAAEWIGDSGEDLGQTGIYEAIDRVMFEVKE
jgi:hypothetical protein